MLHEAPRPERATGGEPEPSRSAVRAAGAGFMSLFLFSVTLATFGPLFYLPLGYAMISAALVLAILALAWAHRAGHELRLNEHVVGSAYIAIGIWTGLFAFFASLYYLGYFFVVFHPFFWPVWLVGLLIAWAVHSDRARREWSQMEARGLRGVAP